MRRFAWVNVLLGVLGSVYAAMAGWQALGVAYKFFLSGFFAMPFLLLVPIVFKVRPNFGLFLTSVILLWQVAVYYAAIGIALHWAEGVLFFMSTAAISAALLLGIGLYILGTFLRTWIRAAREKGRTAAHGRNGA